ncbi:hypothetical protein cyc_01657 [Cyclospora cayetanensis]|uniref:Uncharacterized protein n=1 Tax=Cyclospora cayetanensis TaxID=88456 RepID=A0A1D3D5K8_9EIME|nr:hypothetical protein cyc_01657 [Cyclospora cayetanensis]
MAADSERGGAVSRLEEAAAAAARLHKHRNSLECRSTRAEEAANAIAVCRKARDISRNSREERLCNKASPPLQAAGLVLGASTTPSGEVCMQREAPHVLRAAAGRSSPLAAEMAIPDGCCLRISGRHPCSGSCGCVCVEASRVAAGAVAGGRGEGGGAVLAFQQRCSVSVAGVKWCRLHSG